MKALLILCLLFCACSVPASGIAADDLQLRVDVTTGENSRDSSSETTTITIALRAKAIVLEKTSSGYHGSSGKTPPSPREYKLSPADREKLIALLESKNLLVTNTIELPADPSTYFYFALSIESALGNKKGAISIGGPRTAVSVKEEKLYQDSIALVTELYRIINSQGGNEVLEELVVPKRTPPQVKASPVPAPEIQ